MPARRKPTEMLEASGAYAKNPARRSQREMEDGEPLAQPDAPLGDAPQDWTDGAARGDVRCQQLLRAWAEIVSEAGFGFLTRRFRSLVFGAAVLKYKIEQASRGYGKYSPSLQAELRQTLAALRMTPETAPLAGSRSKGAQVASEWAELAAEVNEPKKDEPIQ